MENKSSESHVTRKIIQTALFIGLALAVRNFSTMIYFLGAPGMRISFSPIFSRMPALLFGPFYGGLAAGIMDIMAFLLKPEGPYIPLLTLTAILDGVIVGLLWRGLKKVDSVKIQRGLWIAFITIGIVGLFNYINTQFFPLSPVTQAIDAIGKNKGFLDLGLLAVSLVGLILLTINYAVQKKFPNAPLHKHYLKLLITFGSAGLTVTTINTGILQLFIPELGKVGFVLFLIPRLVKESFMMVILSYLAAFLLSIYDRLIKDRT